MSKVRKSARNGYQFDLDANGLFRERRLPPTTIGNEQNQVERMFTGWPKNLLRFSIDNPCALRTQTSNASIVNQIEASCNRRTVRQSSSDAAVVEGLTGARRILSQMNAQIHRVIYGLKKT